MNQFKRAQVIMLPTKKSMLQISNVNNVLVYSDDIRIKHYTTPQHLYITSDDEIKEDDWFYNHFHNVIHKFDKTNHFGCDKDKRCKKVIATTDTSLVHNRKQLYNNGLLDKDEQCFYKELPQLSQQFIEKYIESYNKSNIESNNFTIIDVLVEYEEGDTTYEILSGNPYYTTEYKLKINPKDNTVTIKKLKDSWNREEVKLELKTMHINLHGADKHTLKQINDWIKKNL